MQNMTGNIKGQMNKGMAAMQQLITLGSNAALNQLKSIIANLILMMQQNNIINLNNAISKIFYFILLCML